MDFEILGMKNQSFFRLLDLHIVGGKKGNSGYFKLVNKNIVNHDAKKLQASV